MSAEKNSSPALTERHCKPCEGSTPPLRGEQVEALQKSIPEWEVVDNRLSRSYQFKNYYQTMAFVNAVAWIAHTENHHPDLQVGYNRCRVSYHTHAIGGLSENDFICAARVDALNRF